MEATNKTRSATINFDGGFSLRLEYEVGRRFEPHEREILKCAIKTMLADLKRMPPKPDELVEASAGIEAV